ncbi:MAG TPA: GGDEF and EAL domain-containing protein [Thermoanaerobaculia bacterium]|nr:GGDEF and EAL domain-containing protein [Thermoanaerobaculia bacterium]
MARSTDDATPIGGRSSAARLAAGPASADGGPLAAAPGVSLLLRTPLVLLAALLSSTLAALAIAVAVTFGAQLDRTLESAEILEERLQLLEVTVEPLLIVEELETAAWMHLLADTQLEPWERKRQELAESLPRTRARLRELAEASAHSGGLARDLLFALDSFEEEYPAIDDPFDAVMASGRLSQTLRWARIAPPESEWFQLASAVFDAQIAPAIPYDHLDALLAMRWRSRGAPALPQAVQDWLAVAIAENLRAGRELESADNARERGLVRPLREALDARRAAAAHPELGRLFSGLEQLDGFAELRAANPFLLGLTPELQPLPEQLHATAALLSLELERLATAARTLLEREVATATARIARQLRWTVAAAAALAIGALALLLWIERHRRRLYRALAQAAEVDQLTGLGNRRVLHRVARRLCQSQRGSVGLLALDLDHFKAINDTYGHQTGDEALAEFAARCRAALRDDDEIIRMGGDELVIVLHRRDDPEQHCRELAQRIVAALDDPVRCRGHELRLQVSIGCATARLPTEIDDLLVEADLALHGAKQASPESPRFALAAVGGGVVRRLPEMLRRGELECEFQPQFESDDDRVVAFEALVRWPGDPVPGITPRTLVDAVEWLGLNRLLLGNVVARVGDALRITGRRFAGRFWINLSASDLATPRAADELLALFEASRLPFERLGVELTETLPIIDTVATRAAFAHLRGHGVAVALDDFSTGSSTLHLLSRLPLDVVKLDRSAVVGIADDQASQVLTRAVLDICRHHGVRCVAEGVESADDVEELHRIGVDAVQGFVLSKPLRLDELAALFDDREARPVAAPRAAPAAPGS